jgi:hypothetical protein
MIRETHQTEDIVSRTTIEARLRYHQSAVRTWQLSLVFIQKATAAALAGFHAFVDSAEQQRSLGNGYWWDSPVTAKHLFKK